MRFILGVLVGYSMRGKNKLLITVLATGAFIVYIILPAVALVALRLDVEQARQSRPAQTRVPALKGLSYEDAEIKLHASNLNIRLLATRYDLPLQPGLIIDQLHNLERRLITVTMSLWNCTISPSGYMHSRHNGLTTKADCTRANVCDVLNPHCC